MAFGKHLIRALAVVGAALALAAPASAAGGTYVFEGGTERERAHVRAALEASAFPWDLVPATIRIHVAPGLTTEAAPGEIWLDSRLVAAGRFAWAHIQHEYAHQVDFFLLGARERAHLNRLLGTRVWCGGAGHLAHHLYGCERFASTLAWAYWPSKDNALRPGRKGVESAAVAPAQFRATLASLIAARSR